MINIKWRTTLNFSSYGTVYVIYLNSYVGIYQVFWKLCRRGLSHNTVQCKILQISIFTLIQHLLLSLLFKSVYFYFTINIINYVHGKPPTIMLSYIISSSVSFNICLLILGVIDDKRYFYQLGLYITQSKYDCWYLCYHIPYCWTVQVRFISVKCKLTWNISYSGTVCVTDFYSWLWYNISQVLWKVCWYGLP